MRESPAGGAKVRQGGCRVVLSFFRFSKLGLREAQDVHRRVKTVLLYQSNRG